MRNRGSRPMPDRCETRRAGDRSRLDINPGRRAGLVAVVGSFALCVPAAAQLLDDLLDQEITEQVEQDVAQAIEEVVEQTVEADVVEQIQEEVAGAVEQALESEIVD